MTTTPTRTDACLVSLARTVGGRVRVTAGGGPFRVVTLGVDERGARVALVPTRAQLLAGDVVEVRCHVADGLTLHLRETSGTVAYDMRGGSASWAFAGQVGDGARLVLDSLPWVSAGGSRVIRSTSVSLGDKATLLARETLVLGRSGEAPGDLVSRTTITRDGRPVVVEELRSLHLTPGRILDSVLALGDARQLPEGGPSPLRLETGDRLWRRLGREAHETADVLDPVWAALDEASETTSAGGTPASRSAAPGG
ncbi:urease accessory protein UreD [Nocardioides astragali]|uniref:Urease accessory protein UreD n=1 Tax=Nocardioides astragali TaxID=1776736 RepID=A0ABW2MZ30_9ACTN|nr:urease accessory protein UreD [Nocardioides astragali]